MKKTLEQQLKEAEKALKQAVERASNEEFQLTVNWHHIYKLSKEVNVLLKKALRAKKRKAKKLQQYKSFYDDKIKRY